MILRKTGKCDPPPNQNKSNRLSAGHNEQKSDIRFPTMSKPNGQSEHPGRS